jgi:protein-tyrosine phosphatase
MSVLERHIPFDTVFNFRDLGGYPTVDGRTTKWRTLFRADGLHRMGDDDLAAFATLGVRTVIDLRTPAELEERGQFSAADVGAAYHHLPVLDAIWDMTMFDDVDRASAFLAARYREMLTGGQAALAGALAVVADPASLPLVFHCAAGKDRTGVVAALVLGVLGVDDDVIAHDYSLSGAGMARFRQWLAETIPEAAERMADQPKAFMEAPAEAMQRFLTDLHAAYGSIAEYVTSIGVGDEVVAALRANLLE